MSSIHALHFSSSAARLFRWFLASEFAQTLLGPVPRPSARHIRALGAFTAVGHPLSYLLWGKWLHQPYENAYLRLAMAALGVALLALKPATVTRLWRQLLTTAILWVTLPLFFFWMFFCNGGNAVWLGSIIAMLFIYNHLAGWRVAALGSATGMAVAWFLFEAAGPQVAAAQFAQAATNAMVIGLCWSVGVVLGIRSSNLQREQLDHTYATVSILARELRMPLSTMALIGDAMRSAGVESGDDVLALKLDRLAARLYSLVRSMNYQIDIRISNAGLMRLPARRETISAADLVREAVANYPFRSTRERESVQIQVRRDFQFQGPRTLFAQVLGNLMKNALHSLAVASTPIRPGDLLLEVDIVRNRGRIVTTDRGVGMDPELQLRIFEPFFSVPRGMGHGLGLAFCRSVAKAAGGSISVRSQPLQGAAFTIELPRLS